MKNIAGRLQGSQALLILALEFVTSGMILVFGQIYSSGITSSIKIKGKR